jgi:hypothetical protein
MEMYNYDYEAEAATKSSEKSKKKVGGAAAAPAKGNPIGNALQNLLKKNTKMKKGIELGSENSVSLDDGDEKDEW